MGKGKTFLKESVFPSPDLQPPLLSKDVCASNLCALSGTGIKEIRRNTLPRSTAIRAFFFEQGRRLCSNKKVVAIFQEHPYCVTDLPTKLFTGREPGEGMTGAFFMGALPDIYYSEARFVRQKRLRGQGPAVRADPVPLVDIAYPDPCFQRDAGLFHRQFRTQHAAAPPAAIRHAHGQQPEPADLPPVHAAYLPRVRAHRPAPKYAVPAARRCGAIHHPRPAFGIPAHLWGRQGRQLLHQSNGTGPDRHHARVDGTRHEFGHPLL